MKRRTFLLAVTAGSGTAYAAPWRGAVRDFGNIPGDRRLAQTRNSRKWFPTLKGIGKGRKALNWKYFEEVSGGPAAPHYQWANNFGEGDCVAQAAAFGCDVLAGTDILAKNEAEQWIAKASVEAIYWGGRVEIGKNVVRRAGMPGDWACRWLQEYGVLHRINYFEQGVDLTGYSPRRSNSRRHKGVPDALEPVAQEHPVKDWAVVTEWAEARDELYKGSVILMCGKWAPYKTRDKDGFVKLQTGWGAEEWNHCQVLIGMDDEFRRPGALMMNSHGATWIKGPKRHGQPDGSYWLDPDDLTRFFTHGNCYVMSNYTGHPTVLPRHHKFY